MYKALRGMYHPYFQQTGSRSQVKIAHRYICENSQPRFSITHPVAPHFLPQVFHTFWTLYFLRETSVPSTILGPSISWCCLNSAACPYYHPDWL